MSGARHTPGPWRVKDQGARIDFLVETDDYDIACIPKGEDDEELLVARADANLIALSPELLDGLREAVDHLELCAGGFPVRRGDTIGRLQALIARAEDFG